MDRSPFSFLDFVSDLTPVSWFQADKKDSVGFGSMFVVEVTLVALSMCVCVYKKIRWLLLLCAGEKLLFSLQRKYFHSQFFNVCISLECLRHRFGVDTFGKPWKMIRRNSSDAFSV